MVQSPVIRRAVLTDIEECLALANREAELPTDLADDLREADRLLLVAQSAGRIVGYGRAMQFRRTTDAPPDSVPTGYYLVGLVVEASYRRMGVGSELTRARLDWISGRATEAWYFANARNAASIALHAQLGFREVTREFSFPGLSFDGNEGILFRAVLTDLPLAQD
jgi:ribosomal protein S18 acetylase RimI-like enzyme